MEESQSAGPEPAPGGPVADGLPGAESTSVRVSARAAVRVVWHPERQRDTWHTLTGVVGGLMSASSGEGFVWTTPNLASLINAAVVIAVIIVVIAGRRRE